MTLIQHSYVYGKRCAFSMVVNITCNLHHALHPLDIDECAEANAELNNCEQNCNNTVCSFECSCWQGYQPVEGAPNRCEGTETEHCCLMVAHPWLHHNCHNTQWERKHAKGTTPTTLSTICRSRGIWKSRKWKWKWKRKWKWKWKWKRK